VLPVGKPSRLARGRRPQLKGVRRDALLTVGTSRNSRSQSAFSISQFPQFRIPHSAIRNFPVLIAPFTLG
jgi:hypothetical protein